MASSPIKTGALPPGFKSPFTRVAQTDGHGDLLAVAATLTNRTLAEVRKMAITLGMRANGPYYLDDALLRKILHELADLALGSYQSLDSVADLKGVNVICFDYEDIHETCRHAIHHTVNAEPNQPSLSYVIDVANWIEPHQQITTDLSHLNMRPAWFLSVLSRAPVGGKSPSNKGK